MKTAKTVGTNDRMAVIDKAVAFALPILGRRNRGTLQRRWFVRWDGRRAEVYKASADDEFCGGISYLEHDRILELYTAFPANDGGSGCAWMGDYSGDKCQNEAELRELILQRVAEADGRYFL